MRKLIRIGCALAAIGFLAIALSCGAGTVALQQHLFVPPRLTVQFGGYRVAGYPVTIRGSPSKRFYSVWVFVKTYPRQGSGPPTEKGEQVLQLPLQSN